jgi:hypothetical protein
MNIYGIITPLRNDYFLIKMIFKTKSKYFNSPIYPSNLYVENTKHSDNYQSANKFNILLGNSASKVNMHHESLLILQKNLISDFTIYCPLSYSGDEDYIKEILNHGNYLFSTDFKPLLDFLSINEYNDFLRKIDVAFFYNIRQRGFGVITTLLGYGKKVFLREENSIYKECLELGIKVFSIENEINCLNNTFDFKTRNDNIKIIKKHYSKINLIHSWESIFNDV